MTVFWIAIGSTSLRFNHKHLFIFIQIKSVAGHEIRPLTELPCAIIIFDLMAESEFNKLISNDDNKNGY